jgi:hypothetical protein
MSDPPRLDRRLSRDICLTSIDEGNEACLFSGGHYRDAARSITEYFDAGGDLVTDLIDALVYARTAAAVGIATIETVIGGVIGYSVPAFHAAKAIEVHCKIEGASYMLKTTVSALAAERTHATGCRSGRCTHLLPAAEQPSHRQGRL